MQSITQLYYRHFDMLHLYLQELEPLSLKQFSSNLYAIIWYGLLVLGMLPFVTGIAW